LFQTSALIASCQLFDSSFEPSHGLGSNFTPIGGFPSGKAEPQETAVLRAIHGALTLIHLQFEATRDESADIGHHPFTGIVNLTDNSPIEGNFPALYNPKNYVLGGEIVKDFTNSTRFCVKLTMPLSMKASRTSKDENAIACPETTCSARPETRAVPSSVSA